jgi:O-antigen/teichoic acid export membrane protein
MFRGFATMTAAFAGSDVARGAIAFATSLVVGRGLGPDGFGRWTLCMAWASVWTLLVDLGVGILITREMARSEKGIGAMVGAALVARLGVFLPAALLFYAAAPWLGLQAQSVDGMRVALLVAAAGVAYRSFAPVFRARPASLFAILSVETVSAALQCAGVWWIVEHGGDVVAVMWLAVAAQFAQVVAALTLWRTFVGSDESIEWPSWASVWALVRRALPFALAGLVANGQARLAPLMLGHLSSAAAVGAFGVAWRIGSLVRLLPQAALGGALPVFTHEVRSGRPEVVRTHFDALMRWFAVPAAVGLAFFAQPIIRLTYGVQFVAAATTLGLVGVGLLPSLLNSGRKVFLLAAGRERVVVRWSAVALAIQATTCAALIPRFGAEGAALGLAIGEAAVWVPLRRATAGVAVHHGVAVEMVS